MEENMKRFMGLVVVALLVAFPAVASAQSLGLAGSAGYFFPMGDDFEEAENALGIDGRLFATFTGGLELGVGVARVSGSVEEQGVSVDVPSWQLYVEPRFNLNVPLMPIKPFLGVRAGWIQQSSEVANIEMKASGFTLGGIAGGNITLAPSLALELALLFEHQSFGNAEIDGEEVEDSEATGQMVGLRAGLRFTIPRAVSVVSGL
jgi:hypothetical protein